MIGQIVNYRYEVLEKIGDGDFFAVYRARDKVLNKLVALKVLSREFAEDRQFAETLTAAYRDMSGLAHPSLARVLDAECTNENCVVATEFARGTSVKERVHRAGAVSVPLALDIIIAVLEALEYAHSNRAVHGDIRPQDIVVSPDGEVKLTDFGLSNALRTFPLIADRTQMRSIHYQAPELVEGNQPTISSDIYAVGAVLYEMLTNTVPFDGGSAVAVALKKVKEIPVPPRSINAGVPKSLSDIIMRAIEPSPGQRYASASAMLADLRALRDSMKMGTAVGAPQGTVVAREARDDESDYAEEPMKRGFWWLLGLFVLVMVLVGAGTWVLVRQHGDIRVPPLLGKTWEEAQIAASEVGITLVDDGRTYSDTYAAGKICMVIPEAGSTVPKEKPEVRVKISDGPSLISVPELTNMTELNANETASHAGFTIGKVRQAYSDKVPVGSVSEQDPPGGQKRAPNSAIDLTISLGPKPGDGEETPTTTAESGTTTDTSTNANSDVGERRFNVSVEVPTKSDEAQQVTIKVIDDRGETTAYDDMHDPGDKFTTPVTAEGSNVRIKVYIGGKLVSDKPY